jgi:hypothetical protein
MTKAGNNLHVLCHTSLLEILSTVHVIPKEEDNLYLCLISPEISPHVPSPFASFNLLPL